LAFSFEDISFGCLTFLAAMMGCSNLAALDLMLTGAALMKLKYDFGSFFLEGDHACKSLLLSTLIPQETSTPHHH